MKNRYLYRGANLELHHATGGKLHPKEQGKPFRRMIHFGEDVTFGSGAVFGESATNAVLMHQTDSAKYPSSGVSTTANFNNAKRYATHNGKYDAGVVYKIDAALLDAYDVSAYQVDEHIAAPTIPKDNEVILVSRDCGALPDEIVVDVLDV